MVPVKHDKFFGRVKLQGQFLNQDIYIINLNYKPNQDESLIRKAILCASKLTFCPQISKLISEVKSGIKKLNIKYWCGSQSGTISFAKKNVKYPTSIEEDLDLARRVMMLYETSFALCHEDQDLICDVKIKV